jgi:hypothetical protein
MLPLKGYRIGFSLLPPAKPLGPASGQFIHQENVQLCVAPGLGVDSVAWIAVVSIVFGSIQGVASIGMIPPEFSCIFAVGSPEAPGCIVYLF